MIVKKEAARCSLKLKLNIDELDQNNNPAVEQL